MRRLLRRLLRRDRRTLRPPTWSIQGVNEWGSPVWGCSMYSEAEAWRFYREFGGTEESARVTEN